MEGSRVLQIRVKFHPEEEVDEEEKKRNSLVRMRKQNKLSSEQGT